MLLFLLTAIIVIWFSHIVFSDKIFVHADLGRYFYPLRDFGTKQIKNFNIPLWNPYLSCGEPFVAILQTVVFYPLSLIYYIFPSFDSAFNWYIIIHFFLAGMFMYLLMMYWKFSRPASFVSSIILILSGYFASIINMNTSLSSAVWTPLLFLFYDKSLREKKIKFIFISGLLLCFQFLGGEPTLVYCSFWLLFFYTLGFTWIEYGALRDNTRGPNWYAPDVTSGRHPERAFIPTLRRDDPGFTSGVFPRRDKNQRNFSAILKPASIFCGAFIIFILLAMFQILPFKELLNNSTLALGRNFEESSRWSLTPLEILGFIIPYVRGDITLSIGTLGPQGWLISFYAGIPAIILTVILFFLKPNKKAVFFIAVFLGSILLALGKYTPIYSILYRFLPGLANIRYPAKFISMTTFSLSILAGMGIQSLLDENRAYKKQNIIQWVLIINLLLALLLFLFIANWEEICGFLIKFFLQGKKTSGSVLNSYIFVYINNSKYFCQFFIILTAFSLITVAYLKGKMSKCVFIALITALIIADLAGVNMGITKIMDRRRFSIIPESVKEIKKDTSLFRIMQTQDIWDINCNVYGFDYAMGIYNRKKTFASNTAMQYGIYDVTDYDSILLRDWYSFLGFLGEVPPDLRLKLLSLLNVKYLVSAGHIAEPGLEVIYKEPLESFYAIKVEDKSYTHFYINKNLHCMDRAFLADTAVTAKDKSIVLGIMKNENFDPRKVVVLEEEPPPDVSHKSSVVSQEFCNILNYKPKEVVIEAAVNQPKWLVLSDTYYPGWKVFVDGKKDKIYKADYFLRAVHLENGRHLVKFVYDPFSFRIGSYISLLTLLCFFGFIIKKR